MFKFLSSKTVGGSNLLYQGTVIVRGNRTYIERDTVYTNLVWTSYGHVYHVPWNWQASISAWGWSPVS